MTSILPNALNQALDVAGSLVQSAAYPGSDESNGLGHVVSGQSGSGAAVSSISSGLATIDGLTGMTIGSVVNYLELSGAASGLNDGVFKIVEYISGTSVKISNGSAIAADANNGSIAWKERAPYSLEDDLNYARGDRAAIKGVGFASAVPTYERPSAVGTAVAANLANLAGKTTDAKALVTNRVFRSVSVAAGNQYVTLTSAGNLKHAGMTDRTGIPIQDGADIGIDDATYVEVINPITEMGMVSILNPTKRIYGRTRAGSGISPDSVEVEFRQVTNGADLSTSTSYTWESGQPTTIELFYGYRERLDNLNETALRTTLTNGIIGDAGTAQDIFDIRSAVGINDNETNLLAELTNVTNYYPFIGLSADPSVVEALNALNQQIGDRGYTGGVLTPGQTVTASLQALATALAGTSSHRTIERVAVDIPAGTPHTLPGGLSYTQDATHNGKTMMVFVRGLLRDPGPITGGNDYDEASSTSIIFYYRISAGDHISYVIYS